MGSYSYKKLVMASDMVFAVAAQIEYGIKFKLTDQIFENMSISTLNKFWVAWQALDLNNKYEFENGIQLAKRVQTLVFLEVAIAFNRKEINTTGMMRVYDISSITDEKKRSIFKNPRILRRIGLILAECFDEQTGIQRPCIVIGVSNIKNDCQVSFVTSQVQQNESNHNFYSIAFFRAAELAG